MSYRNARIYRCDICGVESVQSSGFSVLLGYSIISFPQGWTGSDKHYGACYCVECSKNIRKLKHEYD